MSIGVGATGSMTSKLQLLGRSLALQLHMVLRTMRIHDPTNKALLIATENLKDTINTLWAALDGHVRLEFVDGVVYLNDVRIRLDTGVAPQIEFLQQEFEERGLGGLAFARPVDSTSLREFLVHFSRPVESAEDVENLRRSLEEFKDLALELLDPKHFKDGIDEAEALRVDKKTFALQTYAKTVVAAREFVSQLRDGKTPDLSRIHLTRIVQDLVDIATERVNFLLKLAAIKSAHEYAYNHAANTCVLALVLGRALEIDRLELVDLGTAALFADVGFALLPAGVLDQQNEFTPEQRAQVNDAMIRQIRAIIGEGQINESMMRRVIVAYEHHLPFEDPETRERGKTHVFSRIVAVADAFDALTTRRPWREGFAADEALRILSKESGQKYDPLIVKVLINMMGIYPLGSAVWLDTGELAVVYHTANSPEHFERPYVKVLRDANGNPVRRTVIKNLAEETGTRIVRMARPAELEGIDAGMAVVL